MRKTFMNAGIPTPKFMRIHKGEELEAVHEMRLPLIVKPTDRSGSRGIYKLTSFDQLKESVENACAESFEQCAIIEEFIEGEEYSCECISQSGIHHCLAITKKFTTGAPHFIEIGHMEPSGLDGLTCEKVKEQVYHALDALHVQCGASHSEFKVDPESGEIRIIEIGARMGGDCIGSDLVYLSTGYDFVKMVIQTATGQPVEWEKQEHADAAAVRYVMNKQDYDDYLSLRQKNPDAIYRMSNIHYEEKEITDSSKRYGFYIATDSSCTKLRKLLHL